MENSKVANKFLLYSFMFFTGVVVLLSFYFWDLSPVFIWVLFLLILLGISVVYSVVLGPVIFLLSRFFSDNSGNKNESF